LTSFVIPSEVEESLIPKSLAVKDVSTALDMTKGHWATRPVDLAQKPQLESPTFFTPAPRRVVIEWQVQAE
jgi:hypothetical protein